ncbi:phosphoethanolamine [Microthyrium microscopicum]|uniref:ethanolamine-phosphate cytidylyltransferase n=1 Tax=Microthyrium microscopicum TaxID=703497 RepID=A0A6A6U1X6_9PEZI|nr:phosphoethanolamine [Microthyrium microscopicum]
MAEDHECWIPKPGEWPVDPQEDIAVSEDRIWIDGCFDFAHHGHAGASLQARKLGKELLVGIHSDEDILDNKGPTVMTLPERISSVEACRWVTKAVPHAPYVTSLRWVSHYGCQYVGHGDDITSDSSGEDCYRFVKKADRFKVFKRTPGISTTDLVGRMLLCTRSHFINSLESVLAGQEGDGGDTERQVRGEEMTQRIKDYASDATGFNPSSQVWSWTPTDRNYFRKQGEVPDDSGTFKLMTAGKESRKDQRVVYVDGGFDLFSSGHIAFLVKVIEMEEEKAKKTGWYTEEAKAARLKDAGEDYGPAYVVAGVHDDAVINHFKGVNYPIMNIFERGLCALQCKYIHAVIFSAPFVPTASYLKAIPYGLPAAVYHGPTSFMPFIQDPYSAAKSLGIFIEVSTHDFSHVNAGEIVERILQSRALYEERQRVKGVKGLGEEATRTREILEEEARQKAAERREEAGI